MMGILRVGVPFIYFFLYTTRSDAALQSPLIIPMAIVVSMDKARYTKSRCTETSMRRPYLAFLFGPPLSPSPFYDINNIGLSTELFAQKKGAGSTQNGRDSHPKHLGLKCSGGQWVFSGNILVRQRGTKFKAGRGVMRCKDDTLMAVASGIMFFKGRTVCVSPEYKKSDPPTLKLLSEIFTQ